ncbi:unnamed protein product [Protopolystoma xenopodis]|uniref:Uncharacterized protein n=1 Tax=Protopolystoma xenopodis TaxID=117903 RepID=A0A3S5FD53_9PLAT|nr:unnamed protein product [Protopolystoma xenopodis]
MCSLSTGLDVCTKQLAEDLLLRYNADSAIGPDAGVKIANHIVADFTDNDTSRRANVVLVNQKANATSGSCKELPSITSFSPSVCASGASFTGIESNAGGSRRTAESSRINIPLTVARVRSQRFGCVQCIEVCSQAC